MRIVCRQTILMKYYTLFVILEKAVKFDIFHLLQILGGALRVNTYSVDLPSLPSVLPTDHSHQPMQCHQVLPSYTPTLP